MTLVQRQGDNGSGDVANISVANISVANISLFCFMVIQPPPSYEYDLARYLYNNSLSIFQCDDWAVFSDGWESPITLGLDEKYENVSSIPIPGPEAYWGSWQGYRMLINAQVFYRAWEHVLNSSYKKHDFIVKVDPDSGFVPQRLKLLLLDQGELDTPDHAPGKFFTNCWKWTPAGTMQGPLEVLSSAALETFGKRKQECYWSGKKNIPEDHSLRLCLLQFGSLELPLYGALYDSSGCSQPSLPIKVDCQIGKWAVYHPLKGADVYQACWDKIQDPASNSSLPQHAKKRK